MALTIDRSLRRPVLLFAVSATAVFVSLAAMRPALAVEPVGTMSKADFIAASVAPARQSQRDFAVPASVTIAQAILESGWGKSGLAVQNKNFFGIKCFNSSPGPIAIGCQSWNTSECLPICAPTTATFRAYTSALDSFRDHAVFLTTNSRYRPAFAYSDNADEFLYQIWKAGYATSPTYGDDLKRVMVTYNLYQYDAGGTTATASSLDGDGRAEIGYVDAGGKVRAFRNVNGLASFPYPASPITVGYGFERSRTFFADLDGDGKAEIIHLDGNGTMRAFRNIAGLASFPYTEGAVPVGYGFALGRTFFADIDGDGRAELISIDARGTVRAFRNVNGLGGFPYPGAAIVIGYGFDPGRTFFADINGDGRDEILSLDGAGTVRAFRNVNGLGSFPYPESPMIVARGFSAGRTWFADIDGDGRDEIITINAHGAVLAFRNVNGMTAPTYPAPSTPIAYGFTHTPPLFA